MRFSGRDTADVTVSWRTGQKANQELERSVVAEAGHLASSADHWQCSPLAILLTVLGSLRGPKTPCSLASQRLQSALCPCMLYVRTAMLCHNQCVSVGRLEHGRVALAARSEERRGGKGCVSTCISRWSQVH